MVKKERRRSHACKKRNIVYESECTICNPGDSRRVADRERLEDSRAVASLYVGETARSLNERAGEHWEDARSMKDDCHMMENQLAANRVGGEPKFKFKVVKTCRTALERQVREAVRIYLRRAVLNKRVCTTDAS